MSYSANTTDRELHSYFVKGSYSEGTTEYPLDVSSYEEREAGRVFYSEATYHFTDEDGEEYTWNSEDEALEALESMGYSNDY